LIVIALAAVGVSLKASAAGVANENGQKAYTTYCVICHGEKGDGKGVVGVTLDPPPRDFSKGSFVFDTDKDGQKGTDADLAAVIKNGALAYGGSPLMTPWAHLGPQEVQGLIAYIRSLQQAAEVAARTNAEKP
jgi:mono/diheme cytochrome c family protein